MDHSQAKDQGNCFELPPITLEGWQNTAAPWIKTPLEVKCLCVYIDRFEQIDMLDEIMYLDANNIVGINVQMNADKMNKDHHIDVFGPSLLTIGSIQKIYIIDVMKLGS